MHLQAGKIYWRWMVSNIDLVKDGSRKISPRQSILMDMQTVYVFTLFGSK